MLIDDVTIKVSAGNGGRGAVAFNKNVMSLGPAGGSGGRGGCVYVEGVSDLSALNQFRYKKDVKAQDGGQGRDQFRDGADGENLILKVPVGTVLQKSGEKPREEVLKIGERKYFLTVLVKSFLEIWIFCLKRGGVEMATEFIALSGHFSSLAADFTLPHSFICSIISNNG